MPTFFSITIDTLYDRVRRSRSGHGLDHETLETLLRAPGVLEAAVTHSIQDFVGTAVQGGMDEETRTASLMGHLASNLNWYALAAHWTAALCPQDDPIRPCNLFWAQQSRHVEAWRGADFGVAVRTGPDTLRVALYQAKRCDPKGKASLMRRVNNSAIADECIKEDSELPSCEATGYDGTGRVGSKVTALHQVHRFEATRRRGIQFLRLEQGLAVPDYAWCRYAFWHDAPLEPGAPGAPAPTQRSAKDLFDFVRSELRAGRGNASFKTNLIGTDLGEAICFDDGENLHLSASQATQLLGQMQELDMPDFIAIDEDGATGAHLPFWRAVFSLSHPSVTHIAGSGMVASTPSPDLATGPSIPRPR